MVGFKGEPRFCFIRYGSGMGYTTSGYTLIEVAALTSSCIPPGSENFPLQSAFKGCKLCALDPSMKSL